MLLIGAPALAFPNYTTGHISDVTFAGNSVLIRTDAALPDNCLGTPYGWMQISGTYASMNAFVLALWARGDANSVVVNVYTTGVANGYCQIDQIDPPG
jgi:hypothetical protein